MDNAISKGVFDATNKVNDERFARDKHDLEKHDEAIQKLTQLTAEIGQLVKQHDDTIKNHESRIDTLEHKPSVWFDRIVSGIVAAVIAAIVTAVISGNINL